MVGTSGFAWGAAYARYSEFWTTLFPPQAHEVGRYRWIDHDIRRSRYGLLWGFYDGSVYFGPWSRTLKQNFNLYEHIRPVFNSCHRIVDFHVTHVWGGLLDPDAGDGVHRETAIPIVPVQGSHPNLVPAIASVFGASNWASKKSLVTRWGAALGDVGIEAIPDTQKKLVRLRVVHPGDIHRVRRDPYGNVKGYAIERWEVDPESRNGTVTALYREECENFSGTIVYRTYRNGVEYAWPGNPGSSWESHWGFVPLVLPRHIDAGTDFGTSEITHAVLKTIEADDQGSNIGDQARKAVNPPWLLTGAALPPAPPPTAGSGWGPYGPWGPWAGDPFAPGLGMPGSMPPPSGYPSATANLRLILQVKDGIPFFTANSSDVQAKPLFVDIPIRDVGDHINRIQESLFDDYPELRADQDSYKGGLASGVSLDKARQKAKDKIEERRTTYDDSLVCILKMALTMGGTLGFPGFEGLGHGSFESGKLDFHIGDRAVFTPTPADRMETELKRANAILLYIKSGMTIDRALLLTGLEEAKVKEIMDAKLNEEQRLLQLGLATAALAAGDHAQDISEQLEPDKSQAIDERSGAGKIFPRGSGDPGSTDMPAGSASL